jgi:5,10-methylenetetrahydromethanopterin reductase
LLTSKPPVLAMYIAAAGRLDSTLALPPEVLADVIRHFDAGEQERAGLIPDEVLDLFAFSGTPD